MSTPADSPAPPKKRRTLPIVLAVGLALSAGAATALTPRSVLYAAMGGAPADSAAAEPVAFGEFVEMESIVINPRGTDGRRYLMVRVGVEAPTPEMLERLNVLGPAVRDIILETLSRHTVPELSDVTQRDGLKDEVRTAINDVLGADGPVTRVYFTQYVLQ